MADSLEQAQLIPPVGERDHVEGPSTAPVTLVEYGDFECPYCGRAYPIVKWLRQQLGDRVRFVFRHFPLTEVHPHAEKAAEAAEAAGAQDKFWEMHDYLYEHQGALDDEHLEEYARILSLDPGQFEHDLEQGTYRDRIRQDVESGIRSDVEGTPTFYINGERYDGSYEPEELLAAVEKAGRSG